MANQPKLERKEGTPYLEINPFDAKRRMIEDGADVLIENARGWCLLRAIVTDDVPRGVAVAPKGRWAQRSPGGRGINWTTSDDLGDTGIHATFHSNLVHVRPAVETNTIERKVQASVSIAEIRPSPGPKQDTLSQYAGEGRDTGFSRSPWCSPAVRERGCRVSRHLQARETDLGF